MRAGLDLTPTPTSPATPHLAPLPLLTTLAPHLGLTAPTISLAQRAAALLPRLRPATTSPQSPATTSPPSSPEPPATNSPQSPATPNQYWHASATVDPFGTALRLLRDRDALTAHGWRGEPISPRYTALWNLTADLPPGIGDRWAEITATIPTRTLDPDALAIQLVDPLREFPGAIRRALQTLQAHGVPVSEHLPPPASASGDLCAASHATATTPFLPTADGTLQLIRPQGAAAAAEEIAAYLAQLPADELARTLIVSPDATLDAALHRAGLPTTGAHQPTRGALAAPLQLLPLALQLMWAPADPQAALELLSLPQSPVPRRLARALANALRQWPAVGSPDWHEAFANFETEDAHGYGDDAARAAARKQLTTMLLSPQVPREADTVPLAVVMARVDALATWVRARAFAPDDTAANTTAWHAAYAQHQVFARLLQAVGDAEIAGPLLTRLLDAATEEATGATPFQAQAGLASVGAPGAVVEAVETIVWWNFSRGAAPPVHELDLTRGELAALGAAGIEVPSAGERATYAARRWRRPLQMATRRLLLVTPQTAAPGEAVHPHPLWDEIVASIPEDDRDRLAATLVTPRVGLDAATQAPRSVATPQSLPTYVSEWDVPAGSLAPRDRESPSGLGTLVGCSLRWALRYPLKVSDASASYRLSVGPRELGSLAHEVLGIVLQETLAATDDAAATPPDPALAATRASAVFDAIGPHRVAQLFMPGHDEEREDTRLTITRSAAAVFSWLRDQGLQVELAEGALRREFEGREVEGRVDLLAGTPRVVVDFKWGGRTKRTAEIQAGTSFQLATYAYAAAAGGKAMPEVAYFILIDQLMVGRKGGPFDAHTAVDGPTAAQTWDRFLVACRERLGEVAAGRLRAPGGQPGVPVAPAVDGDRLVVPPGCEYCSYDGLCGLAFAGEVAP